MPLRLWTGHYSAALSPLRGSVPSTHLVRCAVRLQSDKDIESMSPAPSDAILNRHHHGRVRHSPAD
jgi:hypothetical protein